MKTGRYTVSLHTGHGDDHYDLFLEEESSLATWRLSGPPESGRVEAERIADHRVLYLAYEGEVSGDRGRVTIHSRGTFRLDGEELELVGGASAGRYRLGAKTLAVIGPRD